MTIPFGEAMERQVCSFCDTIRPADARAYACPTCGAPLRAISRPDWLPGPGATEVPRDMQWKHVRAHTSAFLLLLWGGLIGGLGILVGSALLCAGAGTSTVPFMMLGPAILLLFGGIGVGAFVAGVVQIRAFLNTWKYGKPVDGVVFQVSQDNRANGRDQWAVTFRYDWAEGLRNGAATTFDARAGTLSRGALVTILVDPNDPDTTLLYLP